MIKEMTKEEATIFFSELFHGEHHFPAKLQQYGFGWAMPYKYGMATFDYNQLTKLVVMAHDACIRVEIVPKGMCRVLICIWKRNGREGSMYERHPALESHVEDIRKGYHDIKTLLTNDKHLTGTF